MIRINLLDESQIPKDSQEVQVASERTIKLGGPWYKDWMILAPAIGAVIFFLYLGFYLFAIRSPLKSVVEDLAANQAVMDNLKPQVSETEELNSKFNLAKAESDEYEKFLLSKKNWAKVLSVLSDELPDEIIFNRLDVSVKPFQKKRKTDAGLVLDSVDCVVLGVELEVPEEFQGKVSLYLKKIKDDVWIKTILIGMEDSGMIYNQAAKVYSTRMEVYFSKSGMNMSVMDSSSSTEKTQKALPHG